MSRAIVTSSRYSPGNMTPEALDSLFVGRTELLDNILGRLAESATTRAKHFFLLIGQRGVGKTHFLELLHHRLTHDARWASARSQLKIAFLNEEEWGVASYLDFLIRILKALASSTPGLTQRIDRLYDLHAHSPTVARETAESLLSEYVGHDTLLLICENLVDIFDGLGTEGQHRWRAFMQSKPFWTILATSPALFAGMKLQSSPFFGFFTIRRLELLDFEGALSLLKQKALLDGRRDLAIALDSPLGRARARAIHHLAGGFHRVYIVMSDFLTRESLDDLFPPFMKMIDDLTPYYQDRIRLLAPQQRKLIEFLAQQHIPTMVKDVANRCLISPQTAAKQLGELSRLGFVRRTSVGRDTYCELAEPLMRLCFEVKDKRTRHLELFVDFLRRWFLLRELKTRFEAISHEPTDRHLLDRCHLEEAIDRGERDSTEPLLAALFDEAERCYDRGDFVAAASAMEQVVSERGSAKDFGTLALIESRRGNSSSSLEVAKRGLIRHPNDSYLFFRKADALNDLKRSPEALTELTRALELDPTSKGASCLHGTILLALNRCQEAIESERKLLDVNPTHAHSYYVMALALEKSGRHDEAIAAAQSGIERLPQSIFPYIAMSELLGRTPEDALTYLDRALSVEPDDVYVLDRKVFLLRELSRETEALETLLRLEQLEPGEREHKVTRGELLRALDRVDEAVSEMQRLVEDEPNWVNGWVELANAYEAKHEYAEASQAADRALAIDPRSGSATLTKIHALTHIGKVAEGEREIRRMIHADWPSASERARAWQWMAEIEEQRGNFVAALDAMRTTITLEPGSPIVKMQYLRALAAVDGFDGALNQFVSEFQVFSDAGPQLLALTIIGLLEVELRRKGPNAAVRAVEKVRTALGSRGPEDAFANVVVGFVILALAIRVSNGHEWKEASVALERRLAEAEDCAVALKMLRVGLNYRDSGDERALLELPIEEREVVRDAISKGQVQEIAAN